MPLSILFFYLFLFLFFLSIRMGKQQKLNDAAYRKLKATKECEKRKCAESWHVLKVTL